MFKLPDGIDLGPVVLFLFAAFLAWWFFPGNVMRRTPPVAPQAAKIFQLRQEPALKE